MHRFHTYKTDNNNGMVSVTPVHCNKSAVTILVTLWKPHPSFDRHATLLYINKEKHCEMTEITGVRREEKP